MIERSEFEGWMNLLREDIRGVNDRLDGLNGRTRTNEIAVAVNEQAIAALDTAVKDRSQKWHAWIAGLVVAVASGFTEWLFHR